MQQRSDNARSERVCQSRSIAGHLRHYPILTRNFDSFRILPTLQLKATKCYFTTTISKPPRLRPLLLLSRSTLRPLDFVLFFVISCSMPATSTICTPVRPRSLFSEDALKHPKPPRYFNCRFDPVFPCTASRQTPQTSDLTSCSTAAQIQYRLRCLPPGTCPLSEVYGGWQCTD